MADARKFTDPRAKGYSVRETLTMDRMAQAQQTLRELQVHLWKTMDDETYSKLEQVFDTAIASLMAHEIGIEIQTEERSGADPEEGEPDGV